MRLLFLTPQLPYPTHQGTTIRNFNILRYLSGRHEVSLVTFGTAAELDQAEPLRALCNHIELAPTPTRSLAQRAFATLGSREPDMGLRLKSAAMHRLVREQVATGGYDLLQVEGIEMARYAMRLAQDSHPPIVFDDHNAEYVLQQTAYRSDRRQVKRWHGALYSFIQAQKLARYERLVCRHARCIVAASETDARSLRALDSSLDVRVIPNGVDTTHFVPSSEVCAKPGSASALVFTGKMDFRPNVDAMVWFCDEILPLIRAHIASAHIVIVGQKPAPRLLALQQTQVAEVTGWVTDTRPFVADAAVYIVPLRMGSGTRLKVLEAMAMGKAIVSTSLGIEGIDCVPGRDLLVADAPDEFASRVIDLLQNPDRRHALGLAARSVVEAKYDWKTIVPLFDRIYSGFLH